MSRFVFSLLVLLFSSTSVAYTHGYNNPLTITTTPWPGSGQLALQRMLTYDPTWNKVATSTDPLGIVTRFSYDSTTGNLAQATADSGGAGHFNAANRFTYNSRGQVLTASDPQGVVTQYNYDATSGNLTSIVADYGGAGHFNQTTSFAYDSVGNATAQTDPKGNTTTTAYDAVRRKTSVTAPAPFNAGPSLVRTSYAYDPDGRLTSVTRANGATPQITATTYTAVGQVAARTDPNGNVTRYFYDAADRLQKVTDALGRSTSTTYNARGQLAAVVDATGTTSEQYTYYANGPVAYFMDARGNLTFYGRDGFDRVASVVYAYGTGVQSTEYFGYDANNNLISHTTRRKDLIAFTYDNLNRRTAMTPPPSTPAVTYAYDLVGRLIGVSSNGPDIVKPVPPSGGTVQYSTTYGYDQLNRPTTVSWSPAPAQTAPTASSVTFTHGYNAANQRTSQTVSDNTWLSSPTTASSVNYTVNALNQYTAVNAITPSYDANGNLISADIFDPVPSPTAGITNYVTDPDRRVVLEYDGSTGAILRWYVYGLGSNEVLNRMDVQAGTGQTLIPDIQGSIIATLDSSTGTLTKRGYLPYGESTTSTGAFAYTGQYLDTSGLYNYRARVYSPALGRFLQPDPIGEAGGNNLYRYGENDPLNLTDPQGLAVEGTTRALGDRVMSGETAADIARHGVLGALSSMVAVPLAGLGVAARGAILSAEFGLARIAGYEIAGSAGLQGSTYLVNVPFLRAAGKGSGEGLDVLGRALISQATAAGATSIEIVGRTISNPAVLRLVEGVANKFGMQVERVGNSIRIKGLLSK